MILFVAITICILAGARSENKTGTLYNGYQYRFNTGDAGHLRMIHASRPSGSVNGMHSYLEPNVQRTMRYNSIPGAGYKAFGEGIPQFHFVPSHSLDLGYHQERSSPYLETNIRNQTNLENLELQPSRVSEIVLSSNDSNESEYRDSINDEQRNYSIAMEDIKDRDSKSLEDSGVIEKEISSVANPPIKVLESNTSLLMNSTMNNYESLKQNSERHLSTAFIINHNQLFPYWHPYNFYSFIGNSNSNLYLAPNPFTYGFIPYHYQLIQ
ncbi:hypothetical protein TNIN_193401 [Trichonephila inaurata madagascariensis]|uniref:Uncharacterized protein n=1 Tax=Trichonephila inaurata madagascariensis TaxID=2747483 RepID=A0A8X6Y5W0_9ARAC|nr:hypothetical protein TNIN_193401 [Trichonephila inaurata madagascariensis]